MREYDGKELKRGGGGGGREYDGIGERPSLLISSMLYGCFCKGMRCAVSQRPYRSVVKWRAFLIIIAVGKVSVYWG